MFCCTLLYIHSGIAKILMGKREMVALLNLSSWCLVMVERLFLDVPRGCLWFVIVVFPDHTHLLFLYVISFVLLGAKAKFLRRKPRVLVALEEISEIHIIRDSYTKVFCQLNVFQCLVLKGIVKEYVFVMLSPSHSHGVTFGHIEFLLPIGFPLSKTSEDFL